MACDLRSAIELKRRPGAVVDVLAEPSVIQGLNRVAPSLSQALHCDARIRMQVRRLRRPISRGPVERRLAGTRGIA